MLGTAAGAIGIYIPVHADDVNREPIEFIEFADPLVKQICVENWGGRYASGEISYKEAAKVTSLNTALGPAFKNTEITSFDELQYFTGLTELDDESFYDCEKLESIIFPDLLIKIGDGCFQGCAFKNITLPDHLEYIGYYGFARCVNLEAIVIPDSVTTMRGKTFYFCTNLKHVVLSKGISVLEEGTFAGTAIEEIDIPDNITEIEFQCFYNCDNMKSIYIPDSVTVMGGDIFQFCSNLIDVRLPAYLKVIENYTFDHCVSLPSIVIPSQVTEMGVCVFRSCNKLNILYVNCINPPILNTNYSPELGATQNTFTETNNITEIYVPAESVDAYKTAPIWSDYADKIKAA